MEYVFFNLKRKIVLSFGSLIFITVGAWMMLKPSSFQSSVVHSDFFIFLVGAMSFLFFFCTYVLMSYKFLFKKTALIITDEGFYDFSNLASAGFIDWAQVESIGQRQDQSMAMISIQLHAPSDFIEATRDPIAKFFMRLNYKRMGTPVLIPMVALHIYVDDLESLLAKRFEAYKARIASS
ncbi:STM3941 family protein [Sphingobacterium griseoflavum]|nr:STM3941 family protein [Sphingobacterium griseoflavum]